MTYVGVFEDEEEQEEGVHRVDEVQYQQCYVYAVLEHVRIAWQVDQLIPDCDEAVDEVPDAKHCKMFSR